MKADRREQGESPSSQPARPSSSSVERGRACASAMAPAAMTAALALRLSAVREHVAASAMTEASNAAPSEVIRFPARSRRASCEPSRIAFASAAHEASVAPVKERVSERRVGQLGSAPASASIPCWSN